ncbi:hypothetical protein PCANC_17326 [Puccinia coronata f. sp. avenae]|uniref:Uncharacterized protein n=1 Tax=Puccinia coronata f. sp. avenae TaxID=200324 RepID=A0A2N5SER3_9BASI|nr:hypothetical protein PCANC_17326 [Puccinia coronata f. sp. avenae]
MPKRAHENYAFPPPRLQRERERAGDTGYSPELSPLGAMIAAACLKCTFVKMIRSCKNVTATIHQALSISPAESSEEATSCAWLASSGKTF